MINGRAKGHAFERELIKKFQDEFGECADHLKRNLDQYQVAGKADIEFNNLMNNITDNNPDLDDFVML